jgi:hypothetical protein
MSELVNQIQGINTLFSQLDGELDFLIEENDETRSGRIEFLVNAIESKRNYLKKHYRDEELKQFNPYFGSKIENVETKLEKLIYGRKIYLSQIKELLKISANRKKIAGYQK